MFATAFWVALEFIVSFHILEVGTYSLLKNLSKEAIWWKAVLKGWLLLIAIVGWGFWFWLLTTAIQLKN